MRENRTTRVDGTRRTFATKRPAQISMRSPKSFVPNILLISHCESIFCGDQVAAIERNSCEMNILQRPHKSKCATVLGDKSLFWNILRVKSLESIFCRDQTISDECKIFEMNILRAQPEISQPFHRSGAGQPKRSVST
jgi:hypothetical protein